MFLRLIVSMAYSTPGTLRAISLNSVLYLHIIYQPLTIDPVIMAGSSLDAGQAKEK